MNRIVLVFAIAAALSASAAEVDGIAATVGGRTILRSEVAGELRRTGADDGRFEEMRDRLVERLLILKAAEDAKLTMQEWVVDNRVQEVVDDMFGGDRTRLEAALAAQKTRFQDWRRRIREDLVVGAMRWNTVDKNVSASPAEMKAEYAAHPERYAKGARATVSVVLLKPADRDRRAEVDASIASNGFAAAAHAYSADSHAKDGGVWKDVDPQEVFRPEICAEIAKLRKGGVSPWVDVDGWSFLVRKDDETATRPMTFAEAYPEVEANVKSANAKKLYEEWIARLKAATYVKIH